jgi:regulator of replication initiation timing
MTKQLTPEELSKLQEVVSNYENTSFQIGQITLEIELLKGQRSEMVEQANSFLLEREALTQQLEDTYGRGSRINVQTGEVTE